MERIEEAPETPAEVQLTNEALLAMPMETRLLFMLQTLDKLQRSHQLQSGQLALTKKQELENSSRQGAIIAYKNVTTFITSLFGEELRAHLTPPPEEQH